MPPIDSVRGTSGNTQALTVSGGLPVPIIHGGTCWLQADDVLLLRAEGYEHRVRVADSDHEPTMLIAHFPTPTALDTPFDLIVEPAEGEPYTLLHQQELVEAAPSS